jgi:hypothetical protein
MASFSYLFLLLASLLCGLTGCASVPANSGQTSFSGYAESVFRHQNEISSRLMMLNDSDGFEPSEELEESESKMSEACHLLNDYAEQDKDGDSMSWSFKAKVQSSIPGCDNSIKRVESLLMKLNAEPKQLIIW